MKQKKSLIVRVLCAIGRGFSFWIGREPKVNSSKQGFDALATYKLTVEGNLPKEEKKKPKKKKKTHNRGKYKKTKKKSTIVKLKTKKGRVIKIKAKRGK